MKFLKIIVICLALNIHVSYMNQLPNYYALHSPRDVEKIFPVTVDEVSHLKNQALETVAKITTHCEHPEQNCTYSTTFGLLDTLKSDVLMYAGILDVVINANPHADVREAARNAFLEIDTALTETITLNKKLYTQLNNYVDTYRSSENLTQEQTYFINEVMNDFLRSGVQAQDEKFIKIQQLFNEITALGTEFQNTINNDSSFFLATAEELAGTPQNIIDALEKEDATTDTTYCDTTYYDTTYKITASHAVTLGILEHCEIQETRKKAYLQKVNVAYPHNYTVLTELTNKRDELAQLIGFSSYAALELDNEMAKNIETVENFIAKLAIPATEKAIKEMQQLLDFYPNSQDLVNKEGKLYKWNSAYLKNYYKKHKLSINTTEIAEYFVLENTLDELLKIYEQFFGITFKKQPFTRWDNDLELVQVYKDGALIGNIVLDLFIRANKFSHAASFTAVNGIINKGNRSINVNVLMLNFQKPTKDKPTLLTMIEVETFFHEFGHALHATLGLTTIACLSGTSVKTDFVEMPSQMLEMWLTEPEVLKRVSKHYKTGLPLPDETINALTENACFDAGDFICRQLYLTNVSLQLYKAGSNKNIPALMLTNEQLLRPYCADEENDHQTASFGHLYGYGSKYYGYMWSNVFAKDLFATIKQRGLFNPETGAEYVTKVLSKGGATNPNELLYNFLGRKPNIHAFIEYMQLKPLK